MSAIGTSPTLVRPAAAGPLSATLLTAGLLTAGPLANPAAGQQLDLGPVPPTRVLAQPAGPACSGAGWVVHDDGTEENGVGWDPALVSDGIYVDRFDFGPATTDEILGRVCLRLARLGGDSTIDFKVTFWTLNGPGGDPDRLLGSVPATATGVPAGLPGQFYEVDVSALGLRGEGVKGVGMRWNPQVDQGFFLLTDETVTTPFTNPVGSGDGGATWDEVVNGAPSVRTTMVRAKEDPAIFTDGFESGDTSSWTATVP